MNEYPNDQQPQEENPDSYRGQGEGADAPYGEAEYQQASESMPPPEGYPYYPPPPQYPPIPPRKPIVAAIFKVMSIVLVILFAMVGLAIVGCFALVFGYGWF